jgi:hypothetical protein
MPCLWDTDAHKQTMQPVGNFCQWPKLLQEHMHCGATIAKLEAQLAEYLTFMQRFRSLLKQEEYDQKE